jgi:hypothetical protein
VNVKIRPRAAGSERERPKTNSPSPVLKCSKSLGSKMLVEQCHKVQEKESPRKKKVDL